MKSSHQGILWKILHGVLFLFALFVTAASAYKARTLSGLVPMYVCLWMVVYAGAAALWLFFCRRAAETTISKVTWSGIAAVFAVQLVIALQMQVTPRVDLSHIYDQCVTMIDELHTSKISDIRYFSFYPNNIPLCILIYWVFRLGKMLGLDYRAAGGMFNVLMLLAANCSAWVILRKLTSVRTAAWVMFLILTNPVLYAYASYYYTDTISLGLMMSGLCLMVLGWDRKHKGVRLLLIFFGGFVMAAAVKIRVTSSFILIAVFVAMIWKRQWRGILAFFIPLCIGVAAFGMLWSGIYRYHVNFDTRNTSTSVRTAAWVMFLILTNPVLYAYASYYYTDTISLGLMMSGLCLMVLGWDRKHKGVRLLLIFFGGFVMAAAVKIRVTSSFILIAVFVAMIWKRQWRGILAFFIPLCIGVAAFGMLWSGIYRYHVNFDTRNTSVTAEHFLMMASTGNGTYRNEDVSFTYSFPTHEEKRENNLRVWKERLRENGPVGNFRLAARKEALVWAAGTRGYLQYTSRVVKETPIFQMIAGKWSSAFQNFMQAYNIVIFLLMGIGIAMDRGDDRWQLVLDIYFLGAIVFYVFWEAHARHSTSFIMLLTFLVIPFAQRLMGRGAKPRRQEPSPRGILSFTASR